MKILFINRVDNVNWPPYRDWKSDVSSVSPSSIRSLSLPHRRSTTVSSETNPLYPFAINIPEEICFSATRGNIQTTEENQWYQTALNCKLKPIFMEGKFSSTIQVTVFESFSWVRPYTQKNFERKMSPLTRPFFIVFSGVTQNERFGVS